jgi:predicted nuclease of predicted toxin-antitoxin system
MHRIWSTVGGLQRQRSRGFDVRDVTEDDLGGSTDVTLMRLAHRENRIIVTHDSDFGTLALYDREPLVGILFIRPGQINSDFTIQTLETLLNANVELQPPFIIVVRRTNDDVSIRIRQLQ